MPFPDSPRVIYAKNPLAEVICQLRFPPILRIDSETPAAFQEKVRKNYPLFREKRVPEFSRDLPPEIVKLVETEFPLRAGKVAYDFISEDRIWTVSLNREFLALTTTKYTRWEEFNEHLRLLLDALVEEYAPAFYSRVGLRYKDVIRRSALGLQQTDWSELLQPHIAGELSAKDVAQDIEHTARVVDIRLPQYDSYVRLQHGFALDTENQENCYLIDSDFFTGQKTERSKVDDILAFFNRQAGKLFRWCITERLHEAMGPKPI